VFSSVRFVLGGNVEHLTLVGSDNVSGHGNVLNNRITGNDGGNDLAGNRSNSRCG